MKKRRLLLFLGCSIVAILSFSSLASCSQEEQIDSFTLWTQINEIINEFKTNGNKEFIENKWYSLDENKNDIEEKYQLTGENGKWTGLCFEYINELCFRNGYDYEVSVYSSISDSVAGLMGNKIDFSTGAISITDEREQSVGFSDPFYDNSVICVARKDNNKITCLDDLNYETCKIGVLSGSPDQVFNHPKDAKTKRFIDRIKAVDFAIADKDYDVLSSLTSVSEFANDIGLSTENKNKLVSCYEELVLNVLFAKINKLGPIEISLEYLEKEIKLAINYGTKSYNPFKEYELEMVIFKHNCKNFTHKFSKRNFIEAFIDIS